MMDRLRHLKRWESQLLVWSRRAILFIKGVSVLRSFAEVNWRTMFSPAGDEAVYVKVKSGWFQRPFL